MHTRGSQEALDEKRRKTKKKVCWSTPKRWLLIWNFVGFCCFLFFSTCTSRVHYDVPWKTLLRMTQKCSLINECFQSFSTMGTHVQACVRWSKYTADIFMDSFDDKNVLKIWLTPPSTKKTKLKWIAMGIQILDTRNQIDAIVPKHIKLHWIYQTYANTS